MIADKFQQLSPILSSLEDDVFLHLELGKD